MLRIKIIRTSLLLLIIINSFSANAESFKKNPWFTSKDLMIGNSTYFEIFGGLVYSNMIYSEKRVNEMERNHFFLPDVGFSFRFQRGKWFSFSPRLSYSAQGVSIKDESNYSLKTNNISFTLPFEMQFALSKKERKGVAKFFIFGGPYIATPVSGNISAGNNVYGLKLSDMKKINWGGEGGIGFRIPTFSLESRSNLIFRVSYLRGFNDTYSVFERNIEDQSKREELFITGGERYNNAIKLIICIEIPFKNRKLVSFTAGGDGNRNYKKVIIIDEK